MSAVPVLRWMKDVPDDTLINKMTIPGTHDSYAYQGKWVGGFARCQEWTVQVYHLQYFGSWERQWFEPSARQMLLS